MIDAFFVLAQEGAEPSAVAKWFVEGMSLGAIYALLALGFVIIFKATQVLNFAHGALAALGAFLVASYATIIDVPGRWMPDAPGWLVWTLAVLIALASMVIVGMVLERVFMRPMVGEGLFSLAIVTLGLDVVLRSITNDFIQPVSRPLGDPMGSGILDLGWIRIPHAQIAQMVVAVVAVAAIAVFFRSRTGIAMRATAFDQEAARAQGISVGRVFSLAWAIGAVLAAVAGVFISLFPRQSTGVSPTTAFFAFAAFPAIVVGGLDSIVGAIVGGLIVGFAEAGASQFLRFDFVGIGFGGVVPYLLMMLVLIIRPYGIFGTEEVRRV